MLTLQRPVKDNLGQILVGKLFSVRTQIHVFHLQTTGKGSFAQHKALDDFYNEILEFADSFAEIIQGKTQQIITDYKIESVINYTGVDQVLKYLADLNVFIQAYRVKLPKPSWDNIDNKCQEVIDLIEQTSYKLKFLS